MNAVRQKCRPKHQVLVLKCYPRFQKNASEVKPNPSELSYLLYYASTRRSKLQKVCDFLDKRTTSDVWGKRTGNVQVTLQILRALIDKCPRDLPLFRGATLRCLRTILKSNDLTLVEDSVATFEAFCENQDPATLAADQDYIRQYEEIVMLYASFASKTVRETKAPINWPHAIRYRKAGLRAIKSLASSDSLNSETGRQLSVIIPAILLNIYAEDGHILERLEQRDEEKEGIEKEMAFRRRQSVSTVRTVETVEPDPIAASGTIEDADKIAEEEVEVVALQALRHIFSAVNRGQLRTATSTVLKFIIERSTSTPDGTATVDEARWPHAGSWATTLATMLCSWAPVQDRYVILVATVESLARIPGAESDLNKQLVLAEIIQSLLRSGISFIGLSVMDVLIRLVQHILMLLQISTPATNLQATVQPTDVVISEKGAVIAPGQAAQPLASNPVGVEVVSEPSGTRKLLLARLQKSISSLATHIYYSDQIFDMLAAILSRLKPSPQSGVASAAAAIEDPEKAVDAVASSSSLQEKQNANSFFSFEMARLTALAAVKDILIMANAKSGVGPSKSVGRLRVGAKVWEGTQWLLRDPSEQVRKAYVDAILTWLQLETQKTDLRVVDDRMGSRKEKLDTLAKRAVSSASHREKSPRRVRSTFLQLLHLAIYENAHQFAESEEELLMLHLLLTTLVQKLGVNSLRSGLPMMMRLQEDIQVTDSPTAKVRFGSLVHGYLWAIETQFDFDTSAVGAAINTEIARRREKGLWMKTIQVPPIPLSQIPAAVAASPSPIPLETLEEESLRPFDGRQALVNCIADGYSTSIFSPQSSPPSSPGRSLSVPTLSTALAGRENPSEELTPKILEQLMSNWTKDSCIANTARDTGSLDSISGSRTGTGNASANRGLLAVNIPAASISDIDVPSPKGLHREQDKEHPHREHHISSLYGLVGGPHSGMVPSRRTSASPTPLGSSSVRSALRVEDLKRALSGSKPVSFPVNERQAAGNANDDADSASESMVSAEISMSDVSFTTADNENATSRNSRDGPARPLSASANATPKLESPEQEDVDGIPPVPPLPESIRGSSSAGASPSLALPLTSTSPRTSLQGQQDQRRPYTAPAKESANGSTISPTSLSATGKSKSLKRGPGSVKQSSGLNRAASVTGSASGSKQYFSGLLSKINVSEDDLGEEHGVADTTPPY